LGNDTPDVVAHRLGLRAISEVLTLLLLGDEERSKTGTVHTKSTCGVFSGANVPLIDPATHCVVRDP
ncbi:hypothetical protein QWU95_11630, partial [Neisseria gonorrhoeae]